MEVLKHPKNPILTKDDVPFKVNSIFNAGAIKFNDEYLLLCRVEMPTGKSAFVKAVSKDGVNFSVDNDLCFKPEDHGDFYPYVKWGIEDVRIVKIDDIYYLTYTGYSEYMPLVVLSETKDFKNFTVKGLITEPSNKDCALFPAKINGKYYKVDRPEAGSRKDIWISESPDLIHWGNYKALASCVPGSWESDKIGGSTPPVKTSEGWLMLYHGVRGFGNSMLYKIGVMLLDANEPWKVIGRTTEPILQPEFDYERIGDVGNVVFTNGWVAEANGEIKIYYSGADSNISLATTTTDYLIGLCK